MGRIHRWSYLNIFFYIFTDFSSFTNPWDYLSNGLADINAIYTSKMLRSSPHKDRLRNSPFWINSIVSSCYGYWTFCKHYRAFRRIFCFRFKKINKNKGKLLLNIGFCESDTWPWGSDWPNGLPSHYWNIYLLLLACIH